MRRSPAVSSCSGIIIAITLLCLSRCLSQEANTVWKVFKAESKTLTISAATLSALEVTVEKQGPHSTVTLFGWEKVGPPVATSKELGRIVENCMSKKPGEGDLPGPFLGDTLNFIIQDTNNKEIYLVMHEVKLKRNVLVPVMEMGQVLLEKRSGILVVGDSELRALSENWIKSLK